MLTLYGLGTLVGGGFYALVGKVAGESGMAAPVSFFTAAVVAAFSALSFGELSARYPFSAGESHYVHEAFGRRWLSICVGWLVIATGIVSAAMLANAFVFFLQDVVAIPKLVGVVLIVIVLGAVLVIVLVLVFALWLPLLVLARLTSAIILVIFSVVNLSLIRIKRRTRQAPTPEDDVPTWPIWVPAGGFVLSLAFVGVQLWASLSDVVAGH